jgi:Recombinase
MAGNELSEMRERCFSAKEEKRRAGECPQATICLPWGVGYSKQDGWFYKPEAELVRESFRRFLAGETNYTVLGKPLGVTPQGMCQIFKNPIWTGWKVYDKKRNMASSARGVSADGRQGDRPKVFRDPDEIIRVKVINDPLVTDAEFARVQALVETKKNFHWKYREDTKHNFTYNGFLLCSECQSTIYGKDASGFYYVCRARFWRVKGSCRTSYMRRDRLEEKLDAIIGDQLTDEKFIKRILGALEMCSDASTLRARVARLEKEIKALREKRVRILDGYFEGLVSRPERDARLSDVDAGLRLAEVTLMRETPQPNPTARDLMTAFSPLFDWPVLNRENKRRILRVTVPEIHVSNYAVKGIAVTVPSAGLKRCDIVSRTPAGFDVATLPTRLFLPLNL